MVSWLTCIIGSPVEGLSRRGSKKSLSVPDGLQPEGGRDDLLGRLLGRRSWVPVMPGSST
jgi:hypothetical protein